MNESLANALKSLPHGSSFRFLDHLVSLAGGIEGKATYLVRGDEAFLEGHFPGIPMMPGVILIEAIAQLGGVVAQSDPAIVPLKDLRLTAIRAAKIFGPAYPGETLDVHAKLEGRMGELVQIVGEISGPLGLLATAKITLSGSPSVEMD